MSPVACFLLGILLLASCQSTSTIDTVLSPKPTAPQRTTFAAAGPTETFGSGPVSIAMILEKQTNGQIGPTSIAQRNGAVLAVKDLGTSAVKLVIRQSEGSPASINSTIRDLQAKNARFMIIPGNSKAFSTKSRLPADKTIATFALGETGTKFAYGFMPNGLDSLMSGVRYAASGKSNSVVFIAPESKKTAINDVVARLRSQKIKVIGSAFYRHGQSADKFVAKYAKLLSSASIIAFAGNDQITSQIAKHIRNMGLGTKVMVGREDWPNVLFRAPSLNGTIIAKRDTSGISLIAARYKKSFGSRVTPAAAAAYDIVAVAAGLARGKKSATMSIKQVQRPSGFRGTTGLFRFRRGGTVERLYQIAIVKNGRLKIVDKGNVGF